MIGRGSCRSRQPRGRSAATSVGQTPPPTRIPDNAGIRREPELPEHEAVAPERTASAKEFAFGDEDREEENAAVKSRLLRRQFGSVARQATMDPDDGIGL